MGNAEDSVGRRFPLGIVVLLLAPVIYLASAGPLWGLNQRGLISDQNWQRLCETVYAPVIWLDKETEFFDTPPGAAYKWYVELFEP